MFVEPRRDETMRCKFYSAIWFRHRALSNKDENAQGGDNITEEVPERFSLTVVHQDKKHAFPVCPQAPLRDVFHDPDDPIVVDTSSWMKWGGRWGMYNLLPL